MKKPLKETVTGWVIPPSRDVSMRDVIRISQLIGAEVKLKYNGKRREFIAYTQGGATASAKLGEILTAFPTQKILV